MNSPIKKFSYEKVLLITIIIFGFILTVTTVSWLTNVTLFLLIGVIWESNLEWTLSSIGQNLLATFLFRLAELFLLCEMIDLFLQHLVFKT